MADEMTSRERLETAWNFQEPDRVPIEMNIAPSAQQDTRAAELVALIEQYVDHFGGWGLPNGYFGLDCKHEVEVVEEKPGEYTRHRRTYHTPVGDFSAITYQPTSTRDPNDYAWETHYLSSPDDLRAIIEAPWEPLPFDPEGYTRAVEGFGDRGIVLVNFPQPFGTFVRSTLRADGYSWLITERDLVHDLLDCFTDRILVQLERLFDHVEPKYFSQCGMEMALKPWLSRDMFEEYITSTDGRLYKLIHDHGGKIRIHCHGHVMEYFERLSEIGIDGVEPCEGPPHADVDLAEAKRRVGDRMLLCGNIPSPQFEFIGPDDVEEMVKAAIRDAAAGGGFVLRCTGGHAGTGGACNQERAYANCTRMIEAGVKYGRYPIAI